MLFLKILYKLYVKTLRIYTLGYKPEHSIYLFWHNKMFPLLRVLKGKKGKVLISPSRDGKIASYIVKSYGFDVIESSYRKDRFKGALEILRSYKEGLSIGIIPDGPLGPRYKMKPELFNLLKKLNANLTLIGVGYKNYLEFNSWDRFQLPSPFSKVFVMFFNCNINNFENIQELEKKLNELNKWAEEISKFI
ncbi:MAG: DUF374 domain-containing protein [candidate division WOR-3 bacterium]